MSLKYTFLNKTKQWAVVGPEDEVRVGSIRIPRANGELKPERIIKVTKPFGQDGKRLRLGFVAVLPRG